MTYNIEVKLDDEDKTQHFLISLPIYFEHVKDVSLYSKEGTITLEEVS